MIDRVQTVTNTTSLISNHVLIYKTLKFSYQLVLHFKPNQDIDLAFQSYYNTNVVLQ